MLVLVDIKENDEFYNCMEIGMKNIKVIGSILAITILVIFMQGCEPLIGPYSPTAYKYATSLKAETLALMNKATEPYKSHKAEVFKLSVELNKAYEYVKGVPSNSISAKQWRILIDPDGKLIGKFWVKWKEKKVLSKPFIDEFKKIVSDSFDQIICLEANKEKATECKKIKEK